MNAFPHIAQGEYDISPSPHCWIRLNTWKEGLLSRMGHDLLLDLRGFSLHLRVSDRPELEIELSIPKEQFIVIEPSLSDKDKEDIRKNVTAHLPSSIEFIGSATWTKPNIAKISGDIKIGNTRTPIVFEAQKKDSSLHGTTRFSHSQLNIKPFRAPLGVIRVKEELDLSFSFDFSKLWKE